MLMHCECHFIKVKWS